MASDDEHPQHHFTVPGEPEACSRDQASAIVALKRRLCFEEFNEQRQVFDRVRSVSRARMRQYERQRGHPLSSDAARPSHRAGARPALQRRRRAAGGAGVQTRRNFWAIK
jgi:hypothetical protein